jgi:hypothetical protein
LPLLNYTTKVSAERTLAEIQQLLAKGGAYSVATMYGPGGVPSGVAFQVATSYGLRNFSLPVYADKVQAVMKRQKIEAKLKTLEQAQRVAWRIVKDWLEARLAIIETEVVTLDQVMLPYMQGDNGQTVYELYRDQQLALGTGS